MLVIPAYRVSGSVQLAMTARDARRAACWALLALGPALLFVLAARSASAGDKPLPVQVKAIFQNKCSECHSPTPTNAKESAKARKKWSDFSDLGELKAKHLEAAVQPDKTTLWKSLDEKDMPPDGAKAGGLSADELATLKRWIDAGAPADAGAARSIDTVSSEKLLRIILEDLLSDKVPEIKRQTTRYFTLANFYNNPNESDEKLDLYRQGMFKMINSLSWQSDIVLPKKVDKDGVVWRINLRDLGWSEELWERLVHAYPYGIDYDSGVGKSISSLTSSKLPYLRADWFVFATSQPPFYHDFLGLDGPGGALASLEKRLNVDRIANIRNGNAARAAIQAGVSGVSRNNRLIERHGGSIGGYYWISYDFGSNLAEQDLPANPLGPPEAFRGGLVFQHKGGEIVFALPNHLQGYLLVKSDGTRLDDAPADIVFDANSPSTRAGEIINGISCISCHDHGIKDKVSDEVRARAAADPARFNGHARELVNALYKEKPVMDGLLRKDRQQFLRALDEAHCPSVTIEPVRALFDRFAKANVDSSSAAAEVGLSETEFTTRLEENGLRGLLAEFKTAGVPRDKFIDKFDRIVATLSLGTHRHFDAVVGIIIDDANRTFPIRLLLPGFVGMKYEYSMAGNSHSQDESKVGATIVRAQEHTLAVQLDATAEFLTVDSKGNGIKIAYTVKKFVRTDTGVPSEILPPGSLVIADGPNHFSLRQGGQLTPEQIAALNLVIVNRAAEAPTDDETSGIATPQKIGANWPIDSAKTAAWAATQEIQVSAQDVTGQGTLVGKETVDGKEFLRMQNRVLYHNFSVPLPNGVRMAEGSTMEVRNSFSVPVGGAPIYFVGVTDINMDMRSTTTVDGAMVVTHTTLKIHREGKATLLNP